MPLNEPKCIVSSCHVLSLQLKLKCANKHDLHVYAYVWLYISSILNKCKLEACLHTRDTLLVKL